MSYLKMLNNLRKAKDQLKCSDNNNNKDTSLNKFWNNGMISCRNFRQYEEGKNIYQLNCSDRNNKGGILV